MSQFVKCSGGFRKNLFMQIFQSDSVPIDPFKALSSKPLSTLVVPLCFNEGQLV
jgi:hypothetical protein